MVGPSEFADGSGDNLLKEAARVVVDEDARTRTPVAQPTVSPCRTSGSSNAISPMGVELELEMGGRCPKSRRHEAVVALVCTTRETGCWRSTGRDRRPVSMVMDSGKGASRSGELHRLSILERRCSSPPSPGVYTRVTGGTEGSSAMGSADAAWSLGPSAGRATAAVGPESSCPESDRGVRAVSTLFGRLALVVFCADAAPTTERRLREAGSSEAAVNESLGKLAP